MKIRVLATCLALLSATTFAMAAEVETPDPSSSPATQPQATIAGSHLSADQSLKELANADWRQRRQAVQHLIQIGPGADAMLKELLRRDLDQETRKNVEAALQLVRDNRLLGASLVTLHARNSSPIKVFEQLAQQCGGPLATEPDNLWKQQDWPKLTLDYDHRPFWQVMQDLGARLGLEYLTSDPDEVRLSRGSDRPEAISVNGAFLLTASALGARNRLIVDLSVYCEPKISILRTAELKVDRAIDDQGNVLLPQTGRFFGRGFGRFGRRGRYGSRQLALVFQRPPDGVNKLRLLKGTVAVFVPTARETWQVNDPLALSSTTKVIDSVPVTLENFTRNSSGDGYELQALIPLASRGVQQDEVMELIRKSLKVLDASGRPLTFLALDFRNAGDAIEIMVDFARSPGAPNAKTGRPATVVWQIPTEVRKLVVPYEFKDVSINDPWN